MDSKMIPQRAYPDGHKQAKEKEIIEKIDKIKSRGTISPITNNTEYNTDDYNKLKVLQAELRGFRKGKEEALSLVDTQKGTRKKVPDWKGMARVSYDVVESLEKQISDLEKSFSMLEEQHNEQKETIDKLKAEKEEMLEKIIDFRQRMSNAEQLGVVKCIDIHFKEELKTKKEVNHEQ